VDKRKQRQVLEKVFPGLAKGFYSIMSPATPRYNCIAWAAGEDERCWEPGCLPYAYWPDGISEDFDMDAFIEAFSTLGYEPCEDGKMEEGYEKIALFVDDSGEPKHASRQLASGRWTSKMGIAGEDIEHDLEDIEGSLYGDVSCFMKRKQS